MQASLASRITKSLLVAKPRGRKIPGKLLCQAYRLEITSDGLRARPIIRAVPIECGTGKFKGLIKIVSRRQRFSLADQQPASEAAEYLHASGIGNGALRPANKQRRP